MKNTELEIQQENKIKSFLNHTKLFSIIVIIWIFEIIISSVDDVDNIVSYIYSIMFIIQNIFIFIILVCKRDIFIYNFS